MYVFNSNGRIGGWFLESGVSEPATLGASYESNVPSWFSTKLRVMSSGIYNISNNNTDDISITAQTVKQQ